MVGKYLRLSLEKKVKILQGILHSKFDTYKLRTPPLIVARIALKDRVDLISMMVSFDMIAKFIKIIFVCTFGSSINIARSKHECERGCAVLVEHNTLAEKTKSQIDTYSQIDKRTPGWNLNS